MSRISPESAWLGKSIRLLSTTTGFALVLLLGSRAVQAQKDDEPLATDIEGLRQDEDPDEINVAVIEDDASVALDVRVNVSVEGPPSVSPERSADTSSRHFIAEASGGLLLSPGMGGTSHLLIGAGGRRPGGFLRFYAISGLSHSSLVHHE